AISNTWLNGRYGDATARPAIRIANGTAPSANVASPTSHGITNGNASAPAAHALANAGTNHRRVRPISASTSSRRLADSPVAIIGLTLFCTTTDSCVAPSLSAAARL